jgi:type VI secretion system secreted protein VgrG
MSTTQQGRMMSIATPLGEDFLLINKLSATEALSELFKYDVELLHAETESGNQPTVVDISKILGKPVVITITQRDGTVRYFNGIVNSFSQGNRDKRFSYYYATIVPQVWLLTQKSQSRIFQHLSVPDILKKVFDGLEIDWKLQGTFNARNYCVQYRETDFAFASRLMEEEGIYYYFEHTAEKHKMVIANTPQQHLDCPSKSNIPFFLDVEDQEDWISSISKWLIDYKLQSGMVKFRDYHFELPTTKFDSEQPTIEEVAGNKILEIYDYPGGYARKYDGVDKGGGERPSDVQKVHEDKTQTAKTRMQELDAQYRTINGMSDCCSLTAGYRFKMFNHPNNDLNTQYTLVWVTHEIEQSPHYISGEELKNPYRNSFNCILHTTPFRPPQITPKPAVQGSQTAVVVGPSGEEIFTDKYGRVKVQFHWDREGEYDSNSSCWLRVAQSWAGKKWGMMFIPRIGMEVIVDFFEGDPDQPVITGCVYNAETMPPYTLPDEKTKSTIKSDSSKGGGGFNELRFEDKKGSEQIFIHAEKDIDLRVKNDRRELVRRDRHLIVERDKRERTKRDTHLIVDRDSIEKIKRDYYLKIDGKEAIEVAGSLSLKVGGNVAEEFGANHAVKISGSQTITANMIVLEGQSGITLKVGGNFITISSAGIQIQGTMVMINSGGAALAGVPGTLVPPIDPAEAEIADNADPGSKAPTYKNQRAQQTKLERLKTNAPSHKPTAIQNKEKDSWIEIELVDEDGIAVPGEEYLVTLPDGQTVASGTLDEKGRARVESIDPGNCKITFPKLDGRSWNKK